MLEAALASEAYEQSDQRTAHPAGTLPSGLRGCRTLLPASQDRGTPLVKTRPGGYA